MEKYVIRATGKAEGGHEPVATSLDKLYAHTVSCPLR